jgi:uncharacterized protein YlzI (FlbEa/FlbD family)
VKESPEEIAQKMLTYTKEIEELKFKNAEYVDLYE